MTLMKVEFNKDTPNFMVGNQMVSGGTWEIADTKENRDLLEEKKQWVVKMPLAMSRCKGRKVNGEPCKLFVTQGTDYCEYHADQGTKVT